MKPLFMYPLSPLSCILLVKRPSLVLDAVATNQQKNAFTTTLTTHDFAEGAKYTTVLVAR